MIYAFTQEEKDQFIRGVMASAIIGEIRADTGAHIVDRAGGAGPGDHRALLPW